MKAKCCEYYGPKHRKIDSTHPKAMLNTTSTMVYIQTKGKKSAFSLSIGTV